MSEPPDLLKRDFANLRQALVTRYRMVQDCQDPKLAGKLLAELMRFAADVNTDVAELVDDFLVKLAASRPRSVSSPPPREPSQ